MVCALIYSITQKVSFLDGGRRFGIAAYLPCVLSDISPAGSRAMQHDDSWSVGSFVLIHNSPSPYIERGDERGPWDRFFTTTLWDQLGTNGGGGTPVSKYCVCYSVLACTCKYHIAGTLCNPTQWNCLQGMDR